MAESAISYAATISQEGMWAGVNNNTDFIASATEGVLVLKAQPIKSCLLYTSPSPRDRG